MLKYKEKLQELRENRNLSQSEIAKLLNITKSAYNQFEQQYTIIPLNRLNDVANIFNVSIDYLLSFTSKEKYKNAGKNIDINIAASRLKDVRKENKLTQVKLAKILNIAASVISDYENEKLLISTHALYTICKKYNISSDYLLGKIDEPKYLKQ